VPALAVNKAEVAVFADPVLLLHAKRPLCKQNPPIA